MLQRPTLIFLSVLTCVFASTLCATVFEGEDEYPLFGFSFGGDWYPEPFDISTSHPLYMTILNPMPRSGRVLAPGEVWLSSNVEFSSTYLDSRGRGSERAFFDNELLSANVNFRIGLPLHFDFSASLGFHHFSGGFLDEELVEYHEFWGLPDARGEFSARDEFHGFIDDQNGNRAFDVQPHGLRPGNLNLMLAYDAFGIGRNEHGGLWLTPRVQVKLPTADKGSGLNSGSPDISLGFAATLGDREFGIDANLDLVIPMGYDWKGSNVVEADPYLSTMFSIYGAVSQGIMLRVQFHWSNQAFEVPPGLADSFENPFLILFGGFIKAGPGEVMIAFTEDLSEGSEVDFKLSLGYRMGF